MIIVVKVDDVSYVFFTSGFMGWLKGCVVLYVVLLLYCEVKNIVYEIDGISVVYCVSSYMFDLYFMDFCSVIVVGCTLILVLCEVMFVWFGDVLWVLSVMYCLMMFILFSLVWEILSLKYLRFVAFGGETMFKSFA